MGTLSAMSVLADAHGPSHAATQPLNCALVRSLTPTAMCVPAKLACSFILDTVAVIVDVGLHVPSGGGGGEGER